MRGRSLDSLEPFRLFGSLPPTAGGEEVARALAGIGLGLGCRIG
ncbi:hypothetical protein CLJ1_2633 [Pseudomonas paraeruginosa]|nr:hypothetical protein CLJ1_2633 [Pseudomonas aeruginosa]